MTAFDRAWDLIKSEVLLWPKKFNNQHPLFRNPGPGGFTAKLKDGSYRSHISLPNLQGDYGKRNKDMTDQELINAFLETDAHESMHEALGNAGEDYEKPLHNEYPAMVSEYLQYARRPKGFIPEGDLVNQLLSGGMDDREVAMQIASRMAPMHQQVSPGRTIGGVARHVTGPPRETYEED